MKIKIKAKVYIDGANIFYTQRKMGWSLKWKKVINWLRKEFDIVEFRYYVSLKKGDKSMLKYIAYLKDGLKFTVLTKPLKKIQTEEGRWVYKGNFDVEITADMLGDNSSFGSVILFSGDSDFAYLGKLMKKRGKKFLIVSSRKTISWELKMASDKYFLLDDLRKDLTR